MSVLPLHAAAYAVLAKVTFIAFLLLNPTLDPIFVLPLRTSLPLGLTLLFPAVVQL